MIKFSITLDEDFINQKGWFTVFRLQSNEAKSDSSCESRLNAMFLRPDEKKVYVGRFQHSEWSIRSSIRV